MALLLKQDFTPRILTPRWFAIHFRQNMMIYGQDHIVAILSSGLLFREDSSEIEQDAPSWMDPDTIGGVWLSRGEKVVSLLALCAGVAAFPPRSLNRWTILRMSSYLIAPLALRTIHRNLCGGSVRELLFTMCDYLAVARRGAACCREYGILYAKLASVVGVVESMQALLVRQQSDLVNLLSRASSSLLGTFPWIKGDINWEAVCEPRDSLMKIHHTFLVIQSLLLKHVAMAHYLPTANLKKVYKNHNERIYWVHHELLPLLIDEYKDNIAALDRMYRLLKNCAAEDNATEAKKLGAALNNVWTYSEIHTDVTRLSLELKVALNTSNSIDRFLDACAFNRVDVNLEMLDKDIDDLVNNISKSLLTAQNSQKRVMKLKAQLNPAEPVTVEEVIEPANIVKIDEKPPEVKDEVFYLVKREDDEVQPAIGDAITGPGEKEKQNSKIVLNELKQKLVKREDEMRERERQALKKTMPEYNENVPEFPRQIEVDNADTKGFIYKIKKIPKRRLFLQYKIKHRKPERYNPKGKLNVKSYFLDSDIQDDIYTDLCRKETVTILKIKNKLFVTIWRYIDDNFNKTFSEGSWAATVREDNFRCTKNDLELSGSDSDEEIQHEYDFGNDRKVRVKIFPKLRGKVDDESQLPMEYTFSTGMAMASVLQKTGKPNIPGMAAEEVFVGDGEISNDSGNEAE